MNFIKKLFGRYCSFCSRDWDGFLDTPIIIGCMKHKEAFFRMQGRPVR